MSIWPPENTFSGFKLLSLCYSGHGEFYCHLKTTTVILRRGHPQVRAGNASWVAAPCVLGLRTRECGAGGVLCALSISPPWLCSDDCLNLPPGSVCLAFPRPQPLPPQHNALPHPHLLFCSRSWQRPAPVGVRMDGWWGQPGGALFPVSVTTPHARTEKYLHSEMNKLASRTFLSEAFPSRWHSHLGSLRIFWS